MLTMFGRVAGSPGRGETRGNDEGLAGGTRRRFLLRCIALSGGAAAWLLSSPVMARSAAVLKRIRVAGRNGDTRLVMELSQPVDHNIFTLTAPHRVVIDLADTRASGRLREVSAGDSLLKGVRWASKGEKDLRIVLDLNRMAAPRSFALAPEKGRGHRLVVDLSSRDRKSSQQPVKSSAETPLRTREVVVAIDAGHGGKDPGAIGRRKTREKDVVLAIARQTASLINREKGMRAVLTRDRDVYLPLRDRIQKARSSQADLFLSIHADAARNRKAQGASVYVLSPHGASSEHARWLAKQENDADLIGGVSLDDKDGLLASVLLDLSQTATIEASADVASSLLKELTAVGRVHSRKVEQAGFVVLKSPDIPSVLVETAFISNAREEKRLKTRAYQKQVATAILLGVKRYFRQHAPAGARMADASSGGDTHVIQRGETLSAIAHRYQVDVGRLRKVNALSGDRIRTGQVLRIPLSGS